jgi:hypothetical protein
VKKWPIVIIDVGIGCNISDADATAIAEALKENHLIQKLNLGNVITWPGSTSIVNDCI